MLIGQDGRELEETRVRRSEVGECKSRVGNTFVNNGTVPSSRVDDMATRILAAWYLLGQDAASYPQPNFSAFSRMMNDRVMSNTKS